MRQEATDLATARAELAQQLTAESERTEHQRQRAETAEQQASRATGQIDYISAELTTAREHLEHWQSQAAEQRAELAGLRSELTAARAAIETEKAHGAQRLADQHTRHEETISELRTQLREAGRSSQHRRTSRQPATRDQGGARSAPLAGPARRSAHGGRARRPDGGCHPVTRWRGDERSSCRCLSVTDLSPMCRHHRWFPGGSLGLECFSPFREADGSVDLDRLRHL